MTDKPATLKILKQPTKAYRANTARAEYWKRFNEYDGKPMSELESSITDNPPSLPKKGKLAGKTEPFGPWVSFFKQHKLIKVLNEE